MVRFLHWLDRNAMSGALNEIAVSDRLDAFRAEADLFRDVSFPAISGAGPNGAIIHYHATAETMRLIEPGSLYLIDSGGQYLDGTTDITRTIAIDTPTDEMRDRYTRVLKGHIALATAVFPAGTTGSQLDILARLPLWQAGVTYDHGTGHGVGSYLCVHEGPARIATVPSSQPLLAGMILSNEPGYYKPGGFGVRIENLVVVVPREIVGAERPMLGFEDLTLCPIDMRPIELTLMTEAEIAWLDHYHARVRATLLPLIEEAGVRDWLLQATRRLAELHPG
jgi:Xaa-Pro aminopeptidase